MYFVLTFLLGVFFHLLFSLEYASGSINYFNSDEIAYTRLREEFFDYTEYKFRALWYFLNEMSYLTSGNHHTFANKLLALPFVMLFQLVIYLGFDKNKNFILLPILSPYLIYLGTMDLRDTFIFLLWPF